MHNSYENITYNNTLQDDAKLLLLELPRWFCHLFVTWIGMQIRIVSFLTSRLNRKLEPRRVPVLGRTIRQIKFFWFSH